MWIKLICGFLLLLSINADDSAKVSPETVSKGGIPPDTTHGFDGKLPTPQELWGMLDSMSGISEEEKASLRKELLKNIEAEGLPSEINRNDVAMQTVILLSLLSLVALIFVFFTYKLFKCLSERQTKRKEKKKSK